MLLAPHMNRLFEFLQNILRSYRFPIFFQQLASFPGGKEPGHGTVEPNDDRVRDLQSKSILRIFVFLPK